MSDPCESYGMMLHTKKVVLKSHHPPQKVAEPIFQAIIVGSGNPILDPVLNDPVFDALKG
jgi:hypothetical protein